jgi:hypothetical protein
MRVPAVRTEGALALDLAIRDRVIVHPGFYFDFPTGAYVVVSLLTPPDIFEEGIDRVCRRAES